MASLQYIPNAIGVDEAGRGCLAGPVVAAAVFLDDKIDWTDLNDSKKLTENSREKLYQKIVHNSIWRVVEKSSMEIDHSNILKVTLNAMYDAVNMLNLSQKKILIDGNQRPPFDSSMDISCICSGDAKIVNIAAASIIAKVTRDNIMRSMDEKYPQYGFGKHKGYGTKTHLLALEKCGPCEIHRYSYAPVSRLKR